jgi:hypothetical protein
VKAGESPTMRMRGFVGGVLVALTAVGTLAGCGDQSGDPVGYAPEGQNGQAFLFTSIAVVSHDTSQVLLVATVLAPPPVDGIRLYLNPADQGYRASSDAVFAPVATLTSGWSVYQNVVDGFDPTVSNAILARGARGGLESSGAAVSNLSFVLPTPPVGLARLHDVTLVSPGDSTTTNANPTFSWQPREGIDRWILQVYRLDGAPVYVALVEGTSHQLGVGPGTIFHYIPLLNSGLYRWDVQGLNPGSRVTAQSQEVRQFFAAVHGP